MRRNRLLARRLIVAVALVASGIAGPTARAQAVADERERAIAAIERLGGVLQQDDRGSGVQLQGPLVTDSSLEILKGLTDLRYLFISDAPVTGTGLAGIGRMPLLEWV